MKALNCFICMVLKCLVSARNLKHCSVIVGVSDIGVLSILPQGTSLINALLHAIAISKN